jgi:hypothetical protein
MGPETDFGISGSELYTDHATTEPGTNVGFSETGPTTDLGISELEL